MSDHRTLDAATWGFAALATVSFWQGLALAVTIVAGLISITLGAIRLHDRLRYGRRDG